MLFRHQAHLPILRSRPARHPQGGVPALAAADRPTCLHCLQPMHFIGSVESECFSDDFEVDTLVLLFFCADCKLQCCLDMPE